MNNSFYPPLRVDLVGCWLLATISICAGLLINQFRDSPVPLVYQTKAERLEGAVVNLETEATAASSSVASMSLPSKLSLEDFKIFMEKKGGLVVDARPEIFHRLGHVPGAIALPRDDFENYYRQNEGVLGRSKNQAIAIYCSGDSCEDSRLVETALKRLGYSRISIFEGGWNEWTGAGMPVEINQ